MPGSARALTLVVALLLAIPATAQTLRAKPGDAGWIATDRGCFVWNPLGSAFEDVTWTGACVEGRASGTGALVWRVKDHVTGIYEGEMALGRLNGHGSFTFEDGRRYEGSFRDDELTGVGDLTLPNGNRYRGEFRNYRMHGRGTFTFANGDRYEGEFRNNLPEGTGRTTWANGDRYEGQFHQGLPDGRGTLTSISGIYTGTWIKGCFADPNRRRAAGVDPESCR
jgi:hypothetical protein